MNLIPNAIFVICLAIACIPISFLIGLILYPFYSILRKIFYVPYTKKRLIRKAVEQGHTVTAYLVKDQMVFKNYGKDPMPSNNATYEFEFGGKTYRRYINSYWNLPKTTTFYYQKDGRKAQPANYIGMAENPTWLLQYFVLVVICYIAIFVAAFSVISTKINIL